MLQLLNQCFFTASLLLLVPFSTLGQDFLKGKWYEGNVDLVSGQKLSGRVKYDIGNDVVFVSAQGGIRSFTSSNVLKFQFKEPKKENSRTFVSIAIERSNGYKRKHFYELLEEGAVSFLARSFDTNLRRKSTIQPSYPVSPVSGNASFNESVSPGSSTFTPAPDTPTSYAPSYLIIDEDGALNSLDFGGILFQNKKQKILDCFSKNKEGLEAFLKKKNMNLKKAKSIRKLVSYYNNELSGSK